jgi:hypothetical protein
VLLSFKARYYVWVAFIERDEHGDEHKDEQDDEYETQNDTEESKTNYLTEIHGEKKGAEDKQSIKKQGMKTRSEEEETLAENHAAREAPTVGIAKEEKKEDEER